MKQLGKYSNFLTGLFVIAAGIYFLYSKGIIFANFESVTPEAAYRLVQSDRNVTLLDVRTAQEYRQDGHLAGALLIPVQELKSRLPELEPYRSKRILVYCRSGHRSVKASRILADAGFHPVNLEGGIGNWRRHGLPVKRQAP
ncbi:rhodanese-like domain-containing protein [Hydrogenimonas sp.]